MWQELAQAVCLLLVIEGILPFLYPNRWRRLVVALATVNNTHLRFLGLFSMLIGASALFFVR